MILTKKINGVSVTYAIVDPEIDDINVAFNIGDTVKELGEGFDMAVNFSYANTVSGVPIGRLVVGGKTVMHDIDKTVNRDELYMDADGSLHIGKAAAPVWAIQGSPPLLKDGQNVIAAGVKRDRTGTDIYTRAALRTAVGLTAARKLVILRTYDEVKLDALAAIMASVGCVDALNGDGGGSSYLWPADEGWGRKLGAALTVKKGDEKPMRIVINAGHGPNTPGKRSPDGSLREYHFNSATARYVVDELRKYEGVEILQTFEDSRDVPLEERTDRANAWKANAYVSIHANAFGNEWSTAEGVETYVWVSRQSASAALANAIHRQMIQRTGRVDRGVKSADFHELRETVMPAVLVECGFMTNQKEVALLKSDAYRRTCALAIVAGIVETYGLKRKPEPVQEPVERLPDIQKQIGVKVQGVDVGDGYLIDSVSYVPVRIVAEKLGAHVGWDGKTVSITKEEG